MSSRRNWDSRNPSPASECAPPPRTGGRVAPHSPAAKGVGWGSPNSDDWSKSLALCLLCGEEYGTRPTTADKLTHTCKVSFCCYYSFRFYEIIEKEAKPTFLLQFSETSHVTVPWNKIKNCNLLLFPGHLLWLEEPVVLIVEMVGVGGPGAL